MAQPSTETNNPLVFLVTACMRRARRRCTLSHAGGSTNSRAGTGTHRGHAELAAVLKKASEEVETQYPKPPEFVAQGDRVLIIGVATGKIKATNKPFKDDWVFDITVRDGKVAHVKEYIDTQALARASETAASPRSL